MFTFLLVLQAIIAAALVTVILMQRSEGGGLGMGGSPSGLMSARGAADFLTRATAILATLFVVLSIALATMAATRHSTTIDTSLAHSAPVAPASQTTAPAPEGAPFASAAQNAAAATADAPAPADNSAVPLAQ
jgi:preprotein translocase subunit SecG